MSVYDIEGKPLSAAPIKKQLGIASRMLGGDGKLDIIVPCGPGTEGQATHYRWVSDWEEVQEPS